MPLQSVLVITKDKEKSFDYAQAMCSKLNIESYDINTLDNQTPSPANKKQATIGIDHVRNWQKKLYLKSPQGGKRAGIIKDAEVLTLEAQSALLKLLEEPPNDTIIILLTTNKNILLPTIISRCAQVELEGEPQIIPIKEKQDLTDIIENLPQLSVAQRLKLAQSLGSDKSTALAWLEKATLTLREKLLQAASGNSKQLNNKTAELVSLAHAFQNRYLLLSTTSVNPRFALEDLFLLIS